MSEASSVSLSLARPQTHNTRSRAVITIAQTRSQTHEKQLNSLEHTSVLDAATLLRFSVGEVG
jgi:hypothetical protein